MVLHNTMMESQTAVDTVTEDHSAHPSLAMKKEKKAATHVPAKIPIY